MGDTSIRVSEEAKRQLDLHKRDEESYDDVIRRLASQDKWAGFGTLAEDDKPTREAMHRIRSAMRDGIEEDVSTSR